MFVKNTYYKKKETGFQTFREGKISIYLQAHECAPISWFNHQLPQLPQLGTKAERYRPSPTPALAWSVLDDPGSAAAHRWNGQPEAGTGAGALMRCCVLAGGAAHLYICPPSYKLLEAPK